MEKKNLFFDLDGTIIDSREGIFNSIKYVAKAYDLEIPSNEALDSFIGPPLHGSFMSLYNVDFETADMYVQKYRENYSTKGLFEFALYDGIKESILELSKRYTLFVTTSKPTHFAKKILDKSGILQCFTEVSGSDVNNPDSSKEKVVSYIINKYKLDKDACALIGDTKFDGEGAKQCRIEFFGVNYGFGTKEEMLEYNPVKLFDTAGELKEYF